MNRLHSRTDTETTRTTGTEARRANARSAAFAFPRPSEPCCTLVEPREDTGGPAGLFYDADELIAKEKHMSNIEPFPVRIATPNDLRRQDFAREWWTKYEPRHTSARSGIWLVVAALAVWGAIAWVLGRVL